jgi:hypothetical protein
MKIEIEAETISNILSLVSNLVSSRVPVRWYSIEDCSAAWGLKKSYFHKYRHLLPNFGVFDDPVHKRFSEQSFLEWVKIPLCEWERRWKEMTPNERRNLDIKHVEQIRKSKTEKTY